MTTSNFFFIDSRVENYQALVAGLQATDTWVLLNAEQDGLDQMVRALSGVKDLYSIQIISHGSQGALYLGSTVLDGSNLSSYAAQLANIGSAMTPTGDILLYGCNVAQGDVGVQFINALVQATGADVAASSNATGASQLGGDAVLEQVSGSVETASLPLEGLTGLMAGNTTMGGGIVTTSFGPFFYNRATSMALQADGKILLAGESYNANELDLDLDFALVRYNSDGSLDSSFSGDGMLTTDIGSTDIANAVAVQADGKILLAGYSRKQYSNYSGDPNFALLRYNGDGSLDSSFTGDGVLITDIGAYDEARSMALQPDGKIVLAGRKENSRGEADFALVRYNSDGSLDNSFSGDGMQTTAVGSYWSYGQSVKLQANGKIVLAGTSTNSRSSSGDIDFALARYNSDGSLDNSFSGDGILTTAVGSSEDNGMSVALQPDGKILLAGWSYTSSGTSFALARYNSDGSLDRSFGSISAPNSAPTGSVTISGSATQGQTLSASNTLADADGMGAVSYQWLADGANIFEATGSTFLLSQAQVGKVITVAASYIDLKNTPELLLSNSTTAVTNINDAPTGLVSITGTAAENQTLTAINTLRMV